MAERPSAAAVILASGAGTRVGADMNKAYLPLTGKSLVSWCLAKFSSVPGVAPLVLVIREEDRVLAERAIADAGLTGVEIVTGGATRQESELAAMEHLADRVGRAAIDVVLLHDAARPLVSAGLIDAVLGTARRDGAAMPGVPADDIVRVAGAEVAETLRSVVKAQTPQGFLAAPLLDAYRAAARDGFQGTDTASCVQRYTGLAVHWVPGEPGNFKITYRHDLSIAERLLGPAAG